MTPTDDNTNTTPVILTAIADNRPNLLHTILTTIGGAGGATIETVAQTPLETAVSITLLLRVPKGGTTPLRSALVGLTVQHNIKIHVDEMPDASLHKATTGETKEIVLNSLNDLVKVAQTLGQHGATIRSVRADSNGKITISVVIPTGIDEAALLNEIEAIGAKMLTE